MADVGTKLRQARESAGLSLRDVAAASSGRISAGGLSLVERGEHYPSLRTLEALARVLRVRITVTPRGVTLAKETNR